MRIEIKQLEGREHAVVPTVMAIAGVIAGSHGPLYYPRHVLANSVRQWAGRAVVAYHPDMYSGGYAAHPEVFNKQKVGTLFNARMEGDRLKADAWIDLARAAIVDRRVVDAIRAHKMMEVSTGLGTSIEVCNGRFNNREYQGIVTSCTPDHLAILPDKVGACSIAMGAGFIRNELRFNGTYLEAPALLCG